MKKIILKVLGKKGEIGALDYREIIKNFSQFPQDGQRGFSIDEIRTNIRILDALEKSDEELILEDADHNRLKEIVAIAKFGLAHKNIIEFIDDINNAVTVEKKGS